LLMTSLCTMFVLVYNYVYVELLFIAHVFYFPFVFFFKFFIHSYCFEWL